MVLLFEDYIKSLYKYCYFFCWLVKKIGWNKKILFIKRYGFILLFLKFLFLGINKYVDWICFYI